MVDRHKLTVFYLKSFDMDSVQVGKAVFGKEIHTTLGIEPRTNSNPGRYGNPYSVCWFYLICFNFYSSMTSGKTEKTGKTDNTITATSRL